MMRDKDWIKRRTYVYHGIDCKLVPMLTYTRKADKSIILMNATRYALGDSCKSDQAIVTIEHCLSAGLGGQTGTRMF